MRQILFSLAISGAVLSAQSMLETGAVVAGTTVGGAAGKTVSDGINKTFKTTGKALTAATKSGDSEKETAEKARAEKAKEAADKKVAAAANPSTPALKVSAGVPKAEANNVPPPPPKRVVAARPAPAKRSPVGIPMVMSAQIPSGPPSTPVDVDLAAVTRGMGRDSLLALGTPSARITMYDDSHLVEIYQYRNQTFPSGTVRMRDGVVASIEPRP